MRMGGARGGEGAHLWVGEAGLGREFRVDPDGVDRSVLPAGCGNSCDLVRQVVAFDGLQSCRSETVARLVSKKKF